MIKQISRVIKRNYNGIKLKREQNVMFIVIDGGDGCGKTTQIALLKDRLEREGRTVRLFREPGSTGLGESIRELLLHTEDMSITARSELFLFMAARVQLLAEKIRPALDRGEIVLVDRFLLSTVVYQGYAGNVPVEEVWQIGKIALGNCYPDLTVLLDMDPQEASERIVRPLDRMEKKGAGFHEKVRAGFLRAIREADRYFPGKGVVLNAGRTPEIIADEIYCLVKEML